MAVAGRTVSDVAELGSATDAQRGGAGSTTPAAPAPRAEQRATSPL